MIAALTQNTLSVHQVFFSISFHCHLYKNVDKERIDEVVKLVGLESRINDNDAIIFFNYRPDRAREITKAINFADFDGFERKKVLKNEGQMT